MDDLLSEKEQVEAIRAWWQENGSYVIGGVVLGVALLVGWNQWQGSIANSQLEASLIYETLMGDVADGDLDAAEGAATDLYNNYASTTYPSQARLAMARLYMDKGRDEDAANALRGLLDSEANTEIKLLGKLRLAKVLLYQGQAQAVVELLKNETDSAFAARFGDVLGDAYVDLEQFGAAADAYAIAVADNLEVPTVDRTLVQMKINDLPEAGKVAAVDESLEAPAADDADSAATDEAAADDEADK